MEKISFNQTKNRRITGVATRQILLSMCLIAFTCVCYAQDIIVTRNSTRVEAKVTEINVELVKFKMFDNQDGPVYSLPKSDILTIIYQSGRVETFEQVTAPATTTTPAVTAQPRTQTTQPATPTQRTQAYNTTTQYAGTPSRADLMSRMSVNDPYLYSRYKSGSSLSGVGAGLTIGGLAAMVIGMAIADSETVKNNGTTTVQDTGPGATLAGVGLISAMVGTPLWIVGSTKKRKARNAYLHNYSYGYNVPVQSSPYLQLNVAPNRLGLAYIF